MISAARVWKEEPRILTRMPFELSCVSHIAHYKVEVRARDGGELLWVRPYRTRREAIRAYYGLVGLSPVSKPRELIVTVATIATFTSSVNNAGLTWDAGGSKCPLGTTIVRYLVVGGGANGGGSFNTRSGGGGAGGFVTATGFAVTPGVNYPITVGLNSTSGQNSAFSSVTSVGGGSGGTDLGSLNGGTGGSGGGGAAPWAAEGVAPGGAGTAGQGNAGGQGKFGAGHRSAGGGGGAGTAGVGGDTSAPEFREGDIVEPRFVVGGAGGNGLSSNISGVVTNYSAGGGGASSVQGGSSSGGGVGAVGGVGGAATTRGSGGGGGGAGGPGGAGMPGIVILEFTIVVPPPSAGFNMPMMGM